jgi:transcriptional regulator with XRE-family HTH domain
MTKAERIKALMTSLKMSRAKFSEHFGIPARTIDDWENERREPSDYVVDMLIKLAASEKTIPTAWIVIDMKDNYSDGDSEYYTDKNEAILAAVTAWNNMTEHEQNRRDLYFVGLYALEWNDDLEDFVTKGDPIMIAWDALKK